MNKHFKLIEIKPRIFLLDFKDSYNLAMHFMRYQEYYESPNTKFRGKAFTWIDFMEWYSPKYGNGVFTYARDWAGFNFPGLVIKQVINLKIPDHNKYDHTMKKVYVKCLTKYTDANFYIIGAVGQGFAMRHEIAHGLFYTISEYKKQMTKLVKDLNPSFKNSMFEDLERIGYSKKVLVDECQAYLSTGLASNFDTLLKDEHLPFEKLYNEYFCS